MRPPASFPALTPFLRRWRPLGLATLLTVSMVALLLGPGTVLSQDANSPTDLSVEADNHSGAYVSWTAPAGGGTVTKYVVEWKTGATTETADVASGTTRHRITELTDGSVYTVRVSARRGTQDAWTVSSPPFAAWSEPTQVWFAGTTPRIIGTRLNIETATNKAWTAIQCSASIGGAIVTNNCPPGTTINMQSRPASTISGNVNPAATMSLGDETTTASSFGAAGGPSGFPVRASSGADPSDDDATTDEGKIFIAWDATNTAGATGTLDAYRIFYQQQNADDTWPTSWDRTIKAASDRSHTITGLANGTYRLVVQAVTARIEDHDSNPITPNQKVNYFGFQSELLTLTVDANNTDVPGYPIKGTVTPGSESLVVEWEPPTGGGSVVHAYAYEVRHGLYDSIINEVDSVVWTESPMLYPRQTRRICYIETCKNPRRYEITGLTEGKEREYAVEVRAHNANGAGDWLGVGEQADTTPFTVSSAAVNGTTLTVTFNENLNPGSAPAGSAFTVNTTPRAGPARTIAGTGTATISGKTATVTLASTVFRSETVMVSYSTPSENPLEDAAGKDVADFDNRAVTNRTYLAFSSAAVNGTTLTVTFTEDLDPGSAPAGSAFTVNTDHWAGPDWDRTIAGTGTATLSGRTATVTLASAVSSSVTAVTVSYVKPSQNPLQDADGNDAPDFSDRPVFNRTPRGDATDTTPPGFSGASVMGDRFQVEFTEDLDAGPPAASVFCVTATRYGTTRTICGEGEVRLNERPFAYFLYLTLEEPVVRGETVKLSYTKPSQYPLQDENGNTVNTFSNLYVSNITPKDMSDITAPTFASAKVQRVTEHWERTKVYVTFNENLDFNSLPAGSAFSVSWRRTGENSDRTRRGTSTGTVRTGGRTFMYGKGWIFAPNKIVELTLPEPIDLEDKILKGETVTVSYTKPSQNPLKDLAGNEVATFTDKTVTNTIPLPMVTGVRVSANRNSNWERNQLIMTFDQKLDPDSAPAGSLFTVTATNQIGESSTVRGTGNAVISYGRIVTVTLETTVSGSPANIVRYTKPSLNPLQDLAGNEVADFMLTPVDETLSVTCTSTGYWVLFRGGSVSSNPGAHSGIPCDMAKPAWNFDLNKEPGHIRFIYDGEPGRQRQGNLPPPVNQPVEEVIYTADANNRAVLGADGKYYREERVNGRWQRSISYGPDTEAARNASWNAHNRWQRRPMVNPDGGTFPSGPAPVTPVFESAAVDENTLTLTFDANLDRGSVPAPGAFRVTVNNARRNVAAGGVAVSGKTVRLTLASAVAYGETVKVRYTRPSANPLQGDSGRAVETFADRAVTNNTPETIWSATLTVGQLVTAGYGCWNGSPTECTSALTEDSFTTGDTTYGVTRVTRGISFVGENTVVRLILRMDRSISSDWTLHVGDRQFPVADATLSSGDEKASWNGPGFTWSAGQQVSLRLTAPRVVPVFESAVVDGNALTVTFDANLYTDSVPAPGDFYVTVNGARRNVASGGVAISGKTVTLTLASAVTSTDTVKVRYTRPSAMPLQGANGVAVDTFADQAVTNNTPSVEVIWSATLTVGPAPSGFGCRNVEFTQTECTSALTEDSFTTGGTTYQVTNVSRHTNLFGVTTFLFDLNNVISRDWTLHVGSQEFSFADATLSDDGERARWVNPGFTWSTGQQVSLSLTVPAGGSGGAGGASGNSGGEPASVTGVSVVSSAGADRTYGIGDTIHVRVAFDGPVEVTGSPRLKIDMDPAEWGEKWASYESGSGTSSLTFAHTVVEPNISTQGIAVLANTLELNGGTIQASGVDADLAHTGLAHDANHKVDWQTESDDEEPAGGPTGTSDPPGGAGGAEPEQSAPPSVSGVAVSSDAGGDDTYVKDDVIQVTVTFSEAVDVTGSPQLKIDMDPAEWGEKWAAYQGGSGTSSLTFVYTVAEPNISTQGIAVLADTLELNGGTIQASGVDADLSHTGLAHDADHKVDWRLPGAAVTAVEITSDPGDDNTYASDDVISITLTFSEAVDVTGTPQVAIDMDPAEWGTKQAAYQSGSGTSSLTFTHTVAEPNISTQGIAVLANTLELNGGTIQSAAEVDADLAHTGLAHDGSHKVRWQPVVTAVSVSSDAGSDNTYARDDTIQVTVTFSEAVDVTGAPQLKIDMDPAEWGEKWAVYEGGSGAKSLTFTHTVAEPNISTQGIAVLENTLQLNGGTIQSATDADADLSHTGLAHDASHKVDWEQAPEEGDTGSEEGGASGDSGGEEEQISPPSVAGATVASSPGPASPTATARPSASR